MFFIVTNLIGTAGSGESAVPLFYAPSAKRQPPPRPARILHQPNAGHPSAQHPCFVRTATTASQPHPIVSSAQQKRGRRTRDFLRAQQPCAFTAPQFSPQHTGKQLPAHRKNISKYLEIFFQVLENKFPSTWKFRGSAHAQNLQCARNIKRAH